MSSRELGEFLPAGWLMRAVNVVLETCGESRESVGALAVEWIAEVQERCMREALFANRTPFVVRDPRENPRPGDALELDGAHAVVSCVFLGYVVAFVEAADGTESRHDLTPQAFREFFGRWNVQRLGAFEAVPQ